MSIFHTKNKNTLLETIRDNEKKDPEDKMRLFLIYYLSTMEEISKEDMEAYEKALADAGCDLTPLEYIKRYVQNPRLWYWVILTVVRCRPECGSLCA